jgi:hypothetical protein
MQKNRRDIVENNLKLLFESRIRKNILNETAGPGWFKELRRLLGPRFTRRYNWPEFMERFANPPGGAPRRLIRINRSGMHQWGNSDAIKQFLEDMQGTQYFRDRPIKQLIINDEGGYIILTDDGSYHYLGPNGPQILPDGWEPYVDDIPPSFGHDNWADPGYWQPYIPAFTIPPMLLPPEDAPLEDITFPGEVPPLLSPEAPPGWQPPYR